MVSDVHSRSMGVVSHVEEGRENLCKMHIDSHALDSIF